MDRKRIQVGRTILGEQHIPVQTMIKNQIKDVEITLKKIDRLAEIGCDIIRVAVPDKESVSPLKEIIKFSPVPVVADIHFDHRLALMAIEAEVHKVRINPGNIGDEKKVTMVIDCLKEYGTPVRIGVNGGSLPVLIKKKFDNHVDAMLETARNEVEIFEKHDYRNIVLSFKSSNVIESIRVNQLASEIFPYPLHIGVTEAGDSFDGLVKNSIGISSLLMNGIGNTIRVSLTAHEEEEVHAGLRILESIGRREAKYEIISCPTCGRAGGEISKMVAEVKNMIGQVQLRKQVKIAVMGCMVNGPGEAENADFGVACGKKKSLLFKNGKKLKVVPGDDVLEEIKKCIKEYELL